MHENFFDVFLIENYAVFFRMRKMNLGAGANWLRGSFFALTVPDLDNANVGNLRLLIYILFTFLTESGKEESLKQH